MLIDSSGRVGIGVTSPNRLLEVSGSGTTTRLTSSTNTSTIEFSTTGGFAYIGSKDGPNVYVETNGSERARIDSSGRLLVGTSTSADLGALIQTAQTTGTGAFEAFQFSNNTAYPFITLAKSRGASVGTNTIVQNGDSFGEIIFRGANGTNYDTAASITARVDGTPGANDMPGRLVFSTTADGSSNPTERMRINSAGTVNHYNGSSYSLAVRSGSSAGTDTHLFLGYYSATSVLNGTYSYGVYTNGNVENTNNSYTGISDIKLKENIVDASSQWSDFKTLQVRNYNFKAETGYSTHTQIGLIAQEVELVSPGLVSESPDRDADGNDLGTVTKSVNYSVLYMKTVKALQEAMERIEVLEQRLADAGIA